MLVKKLAITINQIEKAQPRVFYLVTTNDGKYQMLGLVGSITDGGGQAKVSPLNLAALAQGNHARKAAQRLKKNLQRRLAAIRKAKKITTLGLQKISYGRPPVAAPPPKPPLAPPSPPP